MTSHTTSLEISKRMEELGFEQKSMFYWKVVLDDYNVKPEIVNSYHEDKIGSYQDGEGAYNDWEEKWYSAYLATELGEMLKSKKQIYTNYVEEEDDWVCVYKEWSGKVLMSISSNTMQDAMGLMACYLKEKGLI